MTETAPELADLFDIARDARIVGDPRAAEVLGQTGKTGPAAAWFEMVAAARATTFPKLLEGGSRAIMVIGWDPASALPDNAIITRQQTTWSGGVVTYQIDWWEA